MGKARAKPYGSARALALRAAFSFAFTAKPVYTERKPAALPLDFIVRSPNPMEWTDIRVTVPRRWADTAEAIATGISGGGIYIEDYADLEQ